MARKRIVEVKTAEVVPIWKHNGRQTKKWILIHATVSGFVELQCCGASASGWLIPKIPRARDNSNSFDSNKAASLGLSALIPKNYDASSEENVAAPIKKVVDLKIHRN